MIKSITFKNFFSFKSGTIELHPQENILIGINGSGKSNLIKAIRLLYEGVAGGGLKKLIFDNWGGLDAMTYYSRSEDKSSTQVEIDFLLDAKIISKYGYNFKKDVHYNIMLQKQPNLANYFIREKMFTEGRYPKDSPFKYVDFEYGSGVLFGLKTNIEENLGSNEVNEDDNEESNYPPQLVKYDKFDPQELAMSQIQDPKRFYLQSTIRKAINEIKVYTYLDTTPTSRIRKPGLPTSEKTLLGDGNNLPQVLNTIKINHKDSYRQIVEILKDVNPYYGGFDFNFIGGNIELMLEENKLNKSIHVTNISDGTLRFLCLLSIIMNPERGSLVCIDELELGLHPDMIRNLAKVLKESSSDTQYIVTTHSENFLNLFDLENVRVIEKDEENSSIAKKYSQEEFSDWGNNYSIGKLWRAGDLGGNRW